MVTTITMTKRLIVFLIIASMLVPASGMAYAADSAVLLNETFENYPTGVSPTDWESSGGACYSAADMEIVSDTQRGGKALLISEKSYISKIYKETGSIGESFVVEFDVNLIGGGVNLLTAGITSNKSHSALPLVSIRENKLFAYKSNTAIRLGSGFNTVSLVFSGLTEFDLYLNKKLVAGNIAFPQTGFSSSGGRVVIKHMPDERKMLFDNFRIYSGKAIRTDLKNQENNKETFDYINVNNDAGDYLYFDSTNLDNLTGQYVDFVKTELGNRITLNRLDYQNPNRQNGFIEMEKTCENQVYFEVLPKRSIYMRDNLGRKSSRTYRYLLIETDVKIESFDVLLQLLTVEDKITTPNEEYTTVCAVTENGKIRLCNGVYMADKIPKNEWFNYRAFINMENKTADVYINGECVGENMPINSNIEEISRIRFRMPESDKMNKVWFDNLKVTGLVNPYVNGEVEKTHVFTTEKAEREYLSDKTAFHELSDIMFANGEKQKMSQKGIYENGEKYIAAADFEKAFSVKLELSGGRAGLGGKSCEVKETGGETLVPLMEAARELLGKKVFHHSETGIIIVSDSGVSLNTEDWKYMWERDFNKITLLNDIDYLNNFLVCERPSGEKLLSDAKKTVGSFDSHPRIMINQTDVERMRSLLKTDEKFQVLYEKLIKYVEDEMEKPIVCYEYNDPLRMNVDGYTDRVTAISMAWLLSGDERYFERGYKEIEAIAKFPDYNLATIHDIAEWNETLAIGYDWLYSGMNAEQREFISERILNHSLKPLSEGLYGRIKGRQDSSDWGNFKWFTNMSTVSEAGVVAAAAAVLETDSEYCADVISKALMGFEYPLSQFSPGGGWIEGPNYWNYNCESASYVMLTLKKTFGSYYGLENMRGFSETGKYALSMMGPRGVNPVGDTAGNEYFQGRAMSLIGNIFADNELLSARYEVITNKGGGISPFDLLSYTGEESEESQKEYGKYIEGMESYTIREDMSLESEGMYFSTHFGGTTHYHSQNDCGTFIFDLGGVRWAHDLGMDDYNLQNQLKYKQWQLYRYRAEGHNLMLINPPGDKFELEENKFVPITKYGANENGGYVYADVSGIYEDAEKAKVGYYVGDNMKSVTARYEIELKKASEMYWFMHTMADAEIIDNAAYLSREGKMLAVTYETDAESSDISIMKAEPLPSSPQAAEQNKNQSYRKVAIKLSGSGKVNLTVKMTLLNTGVSPDNIMEKPISEWQLPEKREDVKKPNLNFEVYANGEKVTANSAVRATGGELPKLTVKTEDPSATVEIKEAADIDGTSIVTVRDKSGEFANMMFVKYYIPYVSSFDGYNEIKIKNVEVSSVPQPQNGKDNMLDDNMATRWTCMAKEEYAVFDLGEEKEIDAAAIAFWKGSERNYFYEILVSSNGVDYTPVFKGQSEIKQNDSEYNIAGFNRIKARYIKYINHGNTGAGTAALNGNVLEFKALKK